MQAYGGISRYFVNLLTHLNSSGHKAIAFAPIHKNSYLRAHKNLSKGVYIPGYLPRTAGAMCRLNYSISRPQIRRWHPDIEHATYYPRQFATYSATPKVLTVYDLINELFPSADPGYEAYSTLRRNAAHSADHIIAISNSTANDIQNIWGIRREKITVVHLGCRAKDWNTEEPLDRSSLERPYVLYVGDRGNYKNFVCLLKAFRENSYLSENFVIKCFGGGRITNNERRKWSSLQLPHELVTHTSGPDSALAICYRNAAAFVYPSLYEGFGIPPLEAMASGCPVCLSRTSSMPEVAGDAATYFDPTSPESLASTLQQLLMDSSLRADLIRRGNKRTELFGWEECCNRTLDVYNRLCT
jgi:glycosyltransferase involved in cell wall biosynthesis